MPKFLNNIDLAKNELQNALMHKLAEAPASPAEGQIYYNTTDEAMLLRDGTSFKKMLLSGQVVDADIDANAAIAFEKLASPIADFDLNDVKLTSLADPTSAQDAATKAYVDGVAQGLNVKQSVRAIAMANLDLSGTETVDGVALVDGDRVLVNGQTAGEDNGIYVVNAAGAWDRSIDLDDSAELKAGVFTFVEEGTNYGDSGWVLVSDNPLVLGTDPVEFSQFSGAGQITAGDGLTKSGNTINAVGTEDRISVAADSIDIDENYAGQTSINTLGTIGTGTWEGTEVAVAHGGTGAVDAVNARYNLAAATVFAGAIGDGAATTFNCYHYFDTKNVIVQVYEVATGAQVFPDVVLPDTQRAQIVFSQAPSASQYNVVIQGIETAGLPN